LINVIHNGSLSKFYKTSFEEQNDVMFIEVIDLGEKVLEKALVKPAGATRFGLYYYCELHDSIS
jgi:hypothetical protein